MELLGTENQRHQIFPKGLFLHVVTDHLPERRGQRLGGVTNLLFWGETQSPGLCKHLGGPDSREELSSVAAVPSAGQGHSHGLGNLLTLGVSPNQIAVYNWDGGIDLGEVKIQPRGSYNWGS